MVDLGAEELVVKAPWGNIAVAAWGNPKNSPVLLCHGRIDSLATFQPLIKLLPDSFYYVAIDLPGNGCSDALPKGLPLCTIDTVPTVFYVVEYFRWEKFIYIGHSLGTYIGQFYNSAYPGKITKIILLDPLYNFDLISYKELQSWFPRYYETHYNPDKYAKINGSIESSPKYTYEQALSLLQKKRGLDRNKSELALYRSMSPTDDGFYRLTWDQRYKFIITLQLKPEDLAKLYSSKDCPILTIRTSSTVAQDSEDSAMILRYMRENMSHCEVITVEGAHDLHLQYPEAISKIISEFLLKNFDRCVSNFRKSKL